MAEHPHVPGRLVDAALEASPLLRSRYLAGGGSQRDLRTDLSHALAVVLAVSEPPMIDLTSPDRRRKQTAYVGPDRRRSIVRL